MALIKCRDCGQEISDTANICPHCGFENNMFFCPECGNKISRNALMCPHCGYQSNNSINNSESVNPICLSGMVVAIVSFFIDLFGLMSITALVLSIVGITKATKGKNRTFAIIGIVLSVLELLYKFIQIISYTSY